MGVMSVISDTSPVAAHLRLNDQFLGLAGSSGPCQDTLMWWLARRETWKGAVGEAYHIRIIRW